MKPILALLMLATPTLADHCRVRNNAVVIQSTGAVIVPFAVPVATPVAVASPYVYQHSAAQSYAQSLSAEDAQLLEEFKEFKRQRQAQVKAAVVPQTLLQQNCVKCHTENADAREHLDMSKPLDDAGTKAALKALRSGAMPKGKTLDDTTRGALFDELLGLESVLSPKPNSSGGSKAKPAQEFSVEIIPPDVYDRIKRAEAAGITREDAIEFAKAAESNGTEVDKDPFLFAHQHSQLFWLWKEGRYRASGR